MKVLVISAGFGIASHKEIAKQKNHFVDFVFFNDSNFPTRDASFTPRMNGKIPKMLAWLYYPGYDYYIWMDSYFKMSQEDSVAWFVSQMQGYDALFFKHPYRSSIMSEAEYMESEAEKGNTYLTPRLKGEPVLRQAKAYCADKDFKDELLIAACAFCYSGKIVEDKGNNLMKEWYLQTCIGSVRDQISLPYVLSKFNVNYKLIEENVFGLKYLK